MQSLARHNTCSFCRRITYKVKENEIGLRLHKYIIATIKAHTSKYIYGFVSPGCAQQRSAYAGPTGRRTSLSPFQSGPSNWGQESSCSTQRHVASIGLPHGPTPPAGIGRSSALCRHWHFGSGQGIHHGGGGGFASGFEQELKDAPASISVVTRKELETKNFRDLAEALQGVEGIDVMGGTGKTGGLDISIRGMPSDYTLILIDGRRQNVAGDVTPNGFGAALTSFMPPLSAIERIEVIRGPMSTLYGSDAMGGVVNIITRKVGKEWGGEVSVGMGLPQDSEWGSQYKGSFYINGPIKQDLLGLAVRGSTFSRDASDCAGTGRCPACAGAQPRSAQSRQHSLPS